MRSRQDSTSTITRHASGGAAVVGKEPWVPGAGGHGPQGHHGTARTSLRTAQSEGIRHTALSEGRRRCSHPLLM